MFKNIVLREENRDFPRLLKDLECETKFANILMNSPEELP